MVADAERRAGGVTGMSAVFACAASKDGPPDLPDAEKKAALNKLKQIQKILDDLKATQTKWPNTYANTSTPDPSLGSVVGKMDRDLSIGYLESQWAKTKK